MHKIQKISTQADESAWQSEKDCKSKSDIKPGIPAHSPATQSVSTSLTSQTNPNPVTPIFKSLPVVVSQTHAALHGMPSCDSLLHLLQLQCHIAMEHLRILSQQYRSRLHQCSLACTSHFRVRLIHFISESHSYT